MGTLNPDLLSKDLDAVMNDAVALKDEYRKPTLQPELILLALLRHPDTAAARLLDIFKNSRAVDMPKLDRQVHLAVEGRGAKTGNLRAVYFREGLLRDMINILSQAVSRHIILLGPDGVGKRTLAYSLALLMSEGKGPAGLKNLVQIDETALLDNDQKAVRAGMSQAAGGILFIPHLRRFFGGPIKAEFTKATPIIQTAFLADDPVIISTTTEL